MIQKSNKMIIFAVIAVIIVAVPISFYELPRGGNRIPINVTDSKITCCYLFSGNFMNSCDCSFHPEKNVSLSAYVQESGYDKTSINLTAYKIGTWPIPEWWSVKNKAILIIPDSIMIKYWHLVRTVISEVISSIAFASKSITSNWMNKRAVRRRKVLVKYHFCWYYVRRETAV